MGSLFSIDAFGEEVNATTALVNGAAWPDSARGVDVEPNTSAKLVEADVMEVALEGGYRLTTSAMRSWRCNRMHYYPQPALRVRSHLALGDRTAYELA